MTTIGARAASRQRGHPLLALFSTLSAIVLVSAVTFGLRGDDQTRAHVEAIASGPLPVPLTIEVDIVYYIVATPEMGEAILQAERTAAHDALALGRAPANRNVQILLVQSGQNVATLLDGLDGVTIVDTRKYSEMPPSQGVFAVD